MDPRVHGPVFASFDLVQVHTGTVLYSTYATDDEIRIANDNLHKQRSTSRYVPHGAFPSTALHSA